MEEFKYENSDTYEQNFIRWYNMNCKEKRVHREEEYSKAEGLKVFEKRSEEHTSELQSR